MGKQCLVVLIPWISFKEDFLRWLFLQTGVFYAKRIVSRRPIFLYIVSSPDIFGTIFSLLLGELGCGQSTLKSLFGNGIVVASGFMGKFFRTVFFTG